MSVTSRPVRACKRNRPFGDWAEAKTTETGMTAGAAGGASEAGCVGKGISGTGASAAGGKAGGASPGTVGTKGIALTGAMRTAGPT